MKLHLIAALLIAILVAVPCLAQDGTDGLVKTEGQAADTQGTAPVDTEDKPKDNADESVPEDKPTDNADESVPEELRDEVIEQEKRAVPQLSGQSCRILKRYGYCRVPAIARFCKAACCHDLLSALSCKRVRYTYKRCNHNIGRVYCRKTCNHCLPPQCRSYRSINDITRRQSRYSTKNIRCDNRLATAWYRFVGNTGTYLYNRCPRSNYRCGTAAPGWVNGAYPAVGQSVTRRVCFRWARNCCKWRTTVTITHCRSFYVFYLRKVPNCSLRYCGNR